MWLLEGSDGAVLRGSGAEQWEKKAAWMGNGEGAAARVTFIAADARVSWRAGSYGRLRSSGCGSRTRGVHPWHRVGARLRKVREEERVAVWCGHDAGAVRA